MTQIGHMFSIRVDGVEQVRSTFAAARDRIRRLVGPPTRAEAGRIAQDRRRTRRWIDGGRSTGGPFARDSDDVTKDRWLESLR